VRTHIDRDNRIIQPFGFGDIKLRVLAQQALALIRRGFVELLLRDVLAPQQRL